MNGPTRTGSLLTLAGIASVAFAAAAPAGVVSDPFITVTSTNGSGTSTLTVPLADADPSGGMWSYALPSPVTLSNGSRITALTSIVRPQSGTVPNLISLNITVEGGLSNTTFQVDSAVLDLVPNIFDAARASTGVSITDNNNNGATFSGAGAGGGGYYARYNGSTPFATFYTSPLSAAPSSSASATQASAGYPAYIPIGLATDMRSQWNFTITATDQAAVTSAYFIIPTPGAISLLGLAGLFAARRVRK